MSRPSVDSDFCNFCGFLIQEIGQQKCKACLNYETEFRNGGKRFKICDCEYCVAASFIKLQMTEKLTIGDNVNEYNAIIEHTDNRRKVNSQNEKTQSKNEKQKSSNKREKTKSNKSSTIVSDWSAEDTNSNDWTQQDSGVSTDWPVYNTTDWGATDNHTEDWGATNNLTVDLGALDNLMNANRNQSQSDDPLEAVTSEELAVSEAIKDSWMKQQNVLKAQMILEDSKEVRILKQAIESGRINDKEFYIGGMDISFIKGDNVNACAAFVVLSYPELKVVYEDYELIKLTAPYIPGFLAFREADFLVNLYNKLLDVKPQYKTTVIFLDGNGLLHPREFGLACHVGVLLNVPCLGVAKNLMHIDGLESNDEYLNSKLLLKKGGDTVPLKNAHQRLLGVALRSLDSTTNPIYVSSGHLISLNTAVLIVKSCCKYRIPEPVRKADLNSREFLRKLDSSEIY